MKTIRYIILSAMIITGFISCDFLDKEPNELTPETYFNTEAELNTFLTGVYSPIMQEPFYGSNYPLLHAGGDDLSFYQRSSPTTSILCANASSSTADIMTYWRILYDGINRANILLESADKNQAIAESVRNRVKAEALFLRSFYYFNLIQGWGDVPLRLESVKDANKLSIARTDKQIVYDQVINDIISTIPYLPTSNDLAHTGTVTQSAAQGILARIYLFRAGEHYRDGINSDPNSIKYFEEAKYWALQVKSSNIHDLVASYDQVFIDMASDKYNSTGVKESIWEAELAGNRINSSNQSAGRIGNVIGFGSGTDFSTSETYRNYTGMRNPGYSYRFMFASLKLYELFENNKDTIRGNWNIAPYEYSYATTGEKPVTGRIYFYGKRPKGLDFVENMPCTDYTESQSASKTRCAAKYRREHEAVTPKDKNYTPINFPILRYSDVLLMLAEAENEINGPSELAYECINKVRARVNLDPLSGLSQNEFRETLKDERAMELCFEAIRRWDLIRWGEYYSKMRDMESYTTKDGWGTGHRYAAAYYRITPAYVYFPIPDWELSTNKLVKQNPGW